MSPHDPLTPGVAYVIRDRAEPGVYVGHRKCVSVPWLKPVEDTYPWGSRWPMFRFPDGREIPSDPHHVLRPVSAPTP